ncbi:hypothetical protein ABKV19_002661 [Rosa sericea]
MARYYNDYYSYWDYFPPLQLCFFISILFFILSFTWYINYESMFEDMMFQVKLFFLIIPLILLLVIHFLSGGISFLLPYPEQDSLHRVGAGGSPTPWGVGFLLVFLLFMISYQSSVHERWFPLYSK